MKPTRPFALILCVLALAGAARVPSAAQARPSGRAITFDDLMRLERLSEAQVSPNGKWVAYKVGTPDMEANRTASNIWVVRSEERRVGKECRL